MKSLDEILNEARAYCKTVDPYEKSTSGIRPATSSGPRARAFCQYVLEECQKNGIEPPPGIKDRETFFAELGDDAIAKYYTDRGYSTYSDKQREDLLGFIGKISEPGDTYAQDRVGQFTKSQAFSEADADFLYSSYLVREMVARQKTSQQKVESLDYLNGQSPEQFAETILQAQLEETRKRLGRNFSIPEEVKERRVSMIIGVPGAGKSRCVDALKDQDSHVHIDLDEIATQIAARAGNLSIADNADLIYKEAGKIAEIIAKSALQQGYNIAVEKIGFSKADVQRVAKQYMGIISELGYTPKAGLHCVHVSKECSTVRASQRTVGQMIDGKPLRYYPETEVITKNNVSAFAYLETLEAQVQGGDEEQVFDEFGFIINEGLADADKKITTLSMDAQGLQEQRRRYREAQMLNSQQHQTQISREVTDERARE